MTSLVVGLERSVPHPTYRQQISQQWKICRFPNDPLAPACVGHNQLKTWSKQERRPIHHAPISQAQYNDRTDSKHQFEAPTFGNPTNSYVQTAAQALRLCLGKQVADLQFQTSSLLYPFIILPRHPITEHKENCSHQSGNLAPFSWENKPQKQRPL